MPEQTANEVFVADCLALLGDLGDTMERAEALGRVLGLLAEQGPEAEELAEEAAARCGLTDPAGRVGWGQLATATAGHVRAVREALGEITLTADGLASRRFDGPRSYAAMVVVEAATEAKAALDAIVALYNPHC